ncbi:MAG: iron-containing redox enzyme family protein [Nitrososphaerota archaeon]|nr:iron-containing redox enzyme family protein [Candidatus Calditenuis fumarioli]
MTGTGSLFHDEAYEREIVEALKVQFRLEPFSYAKHVKGSERELHVVGAYTPVKGIFSVGWQGWKELPAAEFVERLIEWHNGFMRDHSGEPFFPNQTPLIVKGELTWEELKSWAVNLARYAGTSFMYEGIAHFRAHLAGLKEVRDMIARHLFEETGHNEMLFDLLTGAFGMSREEAEREVSAHDIGDLHLTKRDLYYLKLCMEGHFVEIAAAQMLRERWIPKPTRQVAIALRKVYKIPERHLIHPDVHSYIDIYHERFGQYILAKYCVTKELQEIAERAFKEAIIREYEGWRKFYETLRASKR